MVQKGAFVYRAKPGGGAICQYRFYLQQMLAGAAIHYRIGAAGVVADHTSDHSPVGGRGFRGKEKTVLGQVPVEVIAYDTRLYPGPFFISVYFQYTTEMNRYIYHNTTAHYLAGQRGTGSAGDQRGVIFSCKVDQGNNIIFIDRNSHGFGEFPIGRGVRSIKLAGGIISVEIALESCF